MKVRDFDSERYLLERRIRELELQEKELTESRDFWKDKYYEVEAIARQINTEWIPANRKLSARAEAAEAKLRAVEAWYEHNRLRLFDVNDDELKALLKEQKP